MKLSSLNFKNFSTTFKMFLAFPISLLFSKKNRNTWLISERLTQARDNGYIFFKYLINEHPNQKVIYIIDKKSSDYNKVKDLGKTVKFDSLKHYFYFLSSKIHISAHVNGCCPSHAPICRYMKKIRKYKDVFIPHGVSYGISEFCLKKYTDINLFICSNLLEYKNVLNNYGYSENEVAYTGFPRLDEWWNKVDIKKQIVVMPTWRVFLRGCSDEEFANSDYFKRWSSFLNNEQLSKMLETSDINLVFYVHNDVKKYAHLFKIKSNRVKIIGIENDIDIQNLLKESVCLITDYSSVHFDFSYMNKPVLYYQFDRDLFFDKQYQLSIFNPEEDGFGPLCFNEDDLLKELNKIASYNFEVEEKYNKRMRSIYEFYDNNNCKRVYEEILNKFGK